MRTGRSTGIHFLIDEYIAKKIVSPLDFSRKDVLEIGPGMGALTAHIKNYHRLYLIEKETSFEKHLSTNFPDAKIIIGDALKIEWPHFDIFISNMPYKITSPLLEKLWSYDFESATIMVQKEVADRILAKPRTKDYSKLSIMMQIKFQIQKRFDVPPSKFNPPPKVYSTVLNLRKNNVNLDEGFQNFINQLFSKRRKKIKNIVDTQEFENNRPEELTIEELITLYRTINGKI